jgi:Cu(I)/Ag(I) efflux system membrane fusion protein
MKYSKSVILFIVMFISSITVKAQPTAFKTSLQNMFTEYIELKDALIQGNSEQAGKEAVELNETASKTKTDSLTRDQLHTFQKELAHILHNTEHIRDNSKNYPHQCEHFDSLTDSFYKLLKAFHFNSTPVYYNYTEEGNEGNTAHWLTNKDEMKNPYFKGATRKGDKRVETL